MPKQTRQRRTDAVAVRDIIDLAKTGSGPAEIERWLKAEKKAGRKFKGITLPHIKTIQQIVRENTPKDPSGPWQFAEADGEDAVLVLPVLAAVLEASEGRLKVSNLMAEWIVRLCQTADDLPPWTIYELAHTYMLRHERQASTDDLNAFLAFAPWRSEENAKRFNSAVQRLELPLYLMFSRHDDGSASLRDSDDDVTFGDLITIPSSVDAPGDSDEDEQQEGDNQ